MALNFPTSPTNGQVYTDATSGASYVYNSSIGVWNRVRGFANGFNIITANGSSLSSLVSQTATIIAGTNIVLSANSDNNSLSISAAGLANTSGVTFAGDLTITGNVGIGTAHSSNFALEVGGAFAAQTKSFLIPHPTKSGMQLRYASLEGPENGVYVRGKSYSNTIELPDYWSGLVDEDTITVHLTPFGRQQNLYVWRVSNNVVYVEGSENLSYYYSVWAERKDVEKLIVEF